MRPNRVAALALAGAIALGAVATPAGAVAAGRGPEDDETHFHAGEQLARTVTLVTGVPISPLLGVSGLGALHWWRTPEASRAALPWYSRPWFWGPGLALALLFALNTTIGSLIPGLKKPMDFVEAYENKVSALVASPIVLLEMRRLLAAGGIWPSGDGAGGGLVESGVASLGGAAGSVLGSLAIFGLSVLALTAFVLVFLAFHAIQVLIALSPSAIFDLFLRAFRLSMLVVAAAAAGLSPWVGAVYGLVLLALCALIAGWSFRMTVFGTVVSWDVLSGRAGAADPATDKLAAFSGKGLDGVPVRSFGRLEPSDAAGWSFRWRPWLVLPSRRVVLGPGKGLALLRSALAPRLVRTGPVRERVVLRFPPRFRGREEGLAARLGAAEVRDGRIVRGLKATWRWLRELVFGAEPASTA